MLPRRLVANRVARPATLDREALLPFAVDGERTLRAEPQRPFVPRGLMLWNAAGLSVEAAIIGRDMQLVVACGKVPAQWFASSQSFEQVTKALAEGNAPGRGWGHWNPLYPGVLVRLEFDGLVAGMQRSQPVQALMWGLTVA